MNDYNIEGPDYSAPHFICNKSKAPIYLFHSASYTLSYHARR